MGRWHRIQHAACQALHAASARRQAGNCPLRNRGAFSVLSQPLRFHSSHLPVDDKLQLSTQPASQHPDTPPAITKEPLRQVRSYNTRSKIIRACPNSNCINICLELAPGEMLKTPSRHTKHQHLHYTRAYVWRSKPLHQGERTDTTVVITSRQISLLLSNTFENWLVQTQSAGLSCWRPNLELPTVSSGLHGRRLDQRKISL